VKKEAFCLRKEETNRAVSSGKKIAAYSSTSRGSRVAILFIITECIALSSPARRMDSIERTKTAFEGLDR
jgi:hypothetical protein